MELTAENVEEIFLDCLFKEGEDTSKYLRGDGIVNSYGFQPERTEAHRAEILELLHELPDVFQAKTGGGMSFLEACVTKDGIQWGGHRNMEQLFCLGLALEIVAEPVPKELRRSLPGGVPYYVVLE